MEYPSQAEFLNFMKKNEHFTYNNLQLQVLDDGSCLRKENIDHGDVLLDLPILVTDTYETLGVTFNLEKVEKNKETFENVLMSKINLKQSSFKSQKKDSAEKVVQSAKRTLRKTDPPKKIDHPAKTIKTRPIIKKKDSIVSPTNCKTTIGNIIMELLERLDDKFVQLKVIDGAANREELTWTLSQLATYFETPVKQRRFVVNQTSFDISQLRIGEAITLPSFVQEIDWLFLTKQANIHQQDPLFRFAKKIVITSAMLAFTDFDLRVSSVWYTVLHGEKWWCVVKPTEETLNAYANYHEEGDKRVDFFLKRIAKTLKLEEDNPKLKDYIVWVKQTEGQTVIIPSGWIHAVHTPIDSLAIGGNFLHGYSIQQQAEIEKLFPEMGTCETFRCPNFAESYMFAANYYYNEMGLAIEKMEQQKRQRSKVWGFPKTRISLQEMRGLDCLINIFEQIAKDGCKDEKGNKVTTASLENVFCKVLQNSKCNHLSEFVQSYKMRLQKFCEMWTLPLNSITNNNDFCSSLEAANALMEINCKEIFLPTTDSLFFSQQGASYVEKENNELNEKMPATMNDNGLENNNESNLLSHNEVMLDYEDLPTIVTGCPEVAGVTHEELRLTVSGCPEVEGIVSGTKTKSQEKRTSKFSSLFADEIKRGKNNLVEFNDPTTIAIRSETSQLVKKLVLKHTFSDDLWQQNNNVDFMELSLPNSACVVNRKFNAKLVKSIESCIKKKKKKGVRQKSLFFVDRKGLNLFHPLAFSAYDTINFNELTSYDTFSLNRKCDTIFLSNKQGLYSLPSLLAWVPSIDMVTATIDEDEIWGPFYAAMEVAQNNRPNIARGNNRMAISEIYMCFGYRQNRTNSDIGEYVFLPNTDSSVEIEIVAKVTALVKKLEEVASHLFDNLSATRMYEHMIQQYNVKTMVRGGLTLAFSVGRNYSSAYHTDKDAFYTIISCYNKWFTIGEHVLYNVCFPDYGFSVKMYNGSVLVYDPQFGHCVANPLLPGSYVMSCFVSAKTLNAFVSNRDYNSFSVPFRLR